MEGQESAAAKVEGMEPKVRRHREVELEEVVVAVVVVAVVLVGVF